MTVNNSPSSSSSTKPTNSTGTETSGERTFATKRLQVATFIHASRKLQFLGAERDPNGNDVVFVFSDPDGIGDELELDYESGQPISAVALFASQKFLRRKLSEALGEGRLEGRLAGRRDGNFNGQDGRDDGNRKGNSNHGVFYDHSVRTARPTSR